MNYFDRPVKRARTIETLEIADIMEIVTRDLERYDIPAEEISSFIVRHVIPLKTASNELILKYCSE